MEESLEIIKPSDSRNTNKDVKGTVLSHPAFHSKDITRKMSHAMLNETCKEKLRDTLKIVKCMIACHDAHNAGKLIMPSSLKQHEGKENSANYDVDEAVISTMN